MLSASEFEFVFFRRRVLRDDGHRVASAVSEASGRTPVSDAGRAVSGVRDEHVASSALSAQTGSRATSQTTRVGPRTRKPALVAILPQLILVGASALLPFYAIFAETAEPRLILSNAFISAAAIWSLLPAVFAAVKQESLERRTRVLCAVSTAGGN